MRLNHLFAIMVTVVVAMSGCRVIDHRGAIARGRDLAMRHPDSGFQGLIDARDLEFEAVQFQTHAHGDLVIVSFRLRDGPRIDRNGQSVERLDVHMKSNGERYALVPEGEPPEFLENQYKEYITP